MLKQDITRPIARAPRHWHFVYAFIALLAIYLSNGRTFGQIDSLPASLLPVALLVDGSITYDGIIEGLDRGKVPSGFRQTDRGLVSLFPVATGLLALPFYAPVIALKALVSTPSLQGWVHFSWDFQKVPAAVFAALAVLAFWRLCEAAEFPLSLSLGLTLWLAFGSELFAIGAQALWQHGPGTLAVIATMDAQLRLRHQSNVRGALALSAFSALAVAIRPSNLLIAGPFGLLALKQNPRLWLPLLTPAAALLALQLAYNLHFFGAILGNYAWVPSAVAPGNLVHGLLGLLFSPGRGLLVYFSIAGLSAAALAIRPRTLADPTAAVAGLGVVAATLLSASYYVWWGGWSYGPRFLSEIEPAILLLLGFARRGMSEGLRRGFLVALFALLPYGGSSASSPSIWVAPPRM